MCSPAVIAAFVFLYLGSVRSGVGGGMDVGVLGEG